MEKTCISCSKSFAPKHNSFGLYCSLLCCNKAKHVLIDCVCEFCAISFSCRPSEIRKFCSKSCGAKSSSRKRSNSLKIEKVCLGCSVKFTTRPCDDNDFCTQPCWTKYQIANRLNVKEEVRNRPAITDMKVIFAKQREDLIKSLTFLMDVVSGVYIIINEQNNMIYIGSSCDIEERWRDHLHQLYSNHHENDHLQKAWNKYGEKTFQFKILEAVEPTKELLEQREQYYLDLYKPYEKNIGYNLYKTAYSPLGSKRTEEQKEAMSIARIGKPSHFQGKKHSLETKETMSRVQQERYNKLKEEGKLPPQTGYEHTEEARKKMVEVNKNRVLPEDFGEKVRSRRLGTKLINGHWVKI